MLERLQDRRQELDARARELEIRENLSKAAEQRLEARSCGDQGDRRRQRRRGAESAKKRIWPSFKNIVTMYENMKPKDAAKDFDRPAYMKILIEVASQFNPRKLSDVMAQMQPDCAEKLTG